MSRQPHVLFVDDEPRILAGLRRMLRTHRGVWDLTFAEGGPAALEVLRSRPCAVVVSDYRMPGLDGAQLLEHVRAEQPEAIRVILSGQTEETNVLRLAALTHEMLHKPTTPEHLVATIERLLSVRAATAAVWRSIATTESLPASPAAVAELLAAMRSEDVSAGVVGSAVERDPSAAADILRLANSSAFSLGNKVSGVGQAVALLGVDTVRSLLLMRKLAESFGLALDDTPWLTGLTWHSVECARLADRLAAGREWRSAAATGALLAEAGQLVLAAGLPDAAYPALLSGWRSAPATPLGSAEHTALATTHAEVGAGLLRLWGLPAAVVDIVAAHDGQWSGAVDGPVDAVRLAHRIVEAELGPVCGAADPVEGEPGPDLVEIIARWRAERSR